MAFQGFRNIIVLKLANSFYYVLEEHLQGELPFAHLLLILYQLFRAQNDLVASIATSTTFSIS